MWCGVVVFRCLFRGGVGEWARRSGGAVQGSTESAFTMASFWKQYLWLCTGDPVDDKKKAIMYTRHMTKRGVDRCVVQQRSGADGVSHCCGVIIRDSHCASAFGGREELCFGRKGSEGAVGWVSGAVGQ